MSLVTGIPLDGRADATLRLAVMLARSGGDELVLCSVIPESWPPGPARVDAEYRAELERTASRVLDEVRAQVPSDMTSRVRVHHAHGPSVGLVELAEEEGATAIVVGSSSAAGLGHVALGGVSGRLVHSAPVSVALPPRGYRCRPTDRVSRITAAYGGTEAADALVVAAAELASRMEAPFRVVSFAVRARPPGTSGVGTGPEAMIVQQWAGEIETAARAALEQVGDSEQLETVIGYGPTWEEALEDVEWWDGDVLVVGSSSTGPVARVFLGSRASKIVRHSPVPVIVLPRSATS